MDVRVYSLVLMGLFLFLELAGASPVVQESMNDLMVEPGDIQDEQTKEEKQVVWTALQKLEQEIAKKQHKKLKDVSKSTSYLFQGDIVLRPKEAVEMAESESLRQKRKMSANEDKRWPLPIPYRFDVKAMQSHDNEEINHIKAAIRHWESLTCITFVEVDANHTNHPILLFKKDTGCWSYVGREKAFKEQEVSIGKGCFHVGTIAHEIGHAIGFWHEHSRPDRENHIIIRYENVKYGKDYNFYKESWRDVVNLDVPYDVGSIMHYGSTDFSYEGHSQTIQTVDPLVQRVPGQRSLLSFYDVKLANLAYCNSRCTKPLKENACLHEGYTDPLNCNRCRCPDGLRGSECQTVEPSYGQPCGGVLQIEGSETYTIQTPGYPNGFLPGQQCNWLIKAKKGKTVYLKVSPEHFLRTQNCSNNSLATCTDDYMEVKYHVSFGATGARFCCTVAPSATIVSKGDAMLVIFRSKNGGFGGFKATVSSDTCGGCALQTPEDQPACVRQITRSCPQKWTIKQKIECPVFFLPPDSDCGGYVNKTVTRNGTCMEEELYCCGQRQLVNGRCLASSPVIVPLATSAVPKADYNVQAGTVSIDNDVDVGWSAWFDVTSCSQPCGGCGKKTVKRTCDNPAYCGGKSEEVKTESCNNQRCTQSFVTLCTQKKKYEYRCGVFWPLKMCTKYQSVLTVCQSFCCQGYKDFNGTCTATKTR